MLINAASKVMLGINLLGDWTICLPRLVYSLQLTTQNKTKDTVSFNSITESSWAINSKNINCFKYPCM